MQRHTTPRCGDSWNEGHPLVFVWVVVDEELPCSQPLSGGRAGEWVASCLPPTFGGPVRFPPPPKSGSLPPFFEPSQQGARTATQLSP